MDKEGHDLGSLDTAQYWLVGEASNAVADSVDGRELSAVGGERFGRAIARYQAQVAEAGGGLARRGFEAALLRGSHGLAERIAKAAMLYAEDQQDGVQADMWYARLRAVQQCLQGIRQKQEREAREGS